MAGHAGLYDSAPVGLVTLDALGGILEINLTACRMLGRERSGLLGHRFASYVADGDKRRFLEYLSQCPPSRSGEEATAEVTLQSHEGGELPVLLRAAAVVDPRAGGRRRHMAITDLAQRRRTEGALRETEQRLAWVLDKIGVGAWLNELPFGRLNWDETTKKLFFVSPDAEPTIELFWSRLHPEDREPTRLAVEEAISKRTVYAMDHRAVHPDSGEIRWIRSIGQATYAPDGTSTRFDGINYDISDRVQAEQSLRESEHHVRRKLASVLDPEGDLGDLELADLIDVEAIQALMNDFYEVTRIPMSIFDVKGRLLVGVGWQDICTRFHRVHPLTQQQCIESDTELTADLAQGEFRLYKCKNNMWDMATPIFVGGHRVGGIFSGQFFFQGEAIDREIFRVQARRCGFDEKAYLDALDRVPRISRETIDRGTAFFRKLAEMISQLGYSQVKLARLLDERDRLLDLFQESERRLKRAQAIAHLGSWELDLVSNQLFWSDEVYRIFGLTPQELAASYEAFLEHVHPEDRAAVDAAYSASVRDGSDSYEVEHRVIRRNTGEIRVVQEKCQHLRDANGRIVRSLGMVLDITERKQAEEALAAAKAVAEAANLAKTQFLANMSHELRTPMNAILGLIDVALTKARDPIAQDCLQSAKESADLLLTLLNDLLDSAKIESGKLELESAPFSLRRMLEQITRVFSVRASEKGLCFYCRVPEGTPDAVLGDRVRLQQVLLNLAGNAIKYTECGEVEISLRAASRDNEAYLEFAVRDTGMGIPLSEQHRLFQPFTQADASMARRFGGTGLGLSICKSLVELMGGQIWVESEPGKGSTFSFGVWLPLAKDRPPDLEASIAVLAAPSVPLHILLVEDNPANQKLAAYILQGRGHLVEVAGDGHEAIDLTQRNRYDVILMDVQMPGMNGLEATAAIRQRETGASRTPIVAMTAHAMKGDRERCLAAGMNGYLSKPLNAHEMIGVVESLARGARCAPQAAAATVRPGEASPEASTVVFNLEEALTRCFNERNMLRDMIQYYFAELNKLFPQMREALEKGELEDVGRLGHRMKGTVVYLGAPRAAQAATRVERFCESGGEDLPNAEEAVNLLEAECMSLQAALSDYLLAVESAPAD